jgi:hypothetical protein
MQRQDFRQLLEHPRAVVGPHAERQPGTASQCWVLLIGPEADAQQAVGAICVVRCLAHSRPLSA